MLIAFKGNDSLLDSKPFIDEEVRFNLLHLIREFPSSLLFTNKNKSIIIGQSGSIYPAWIWTSDTITYQELEVLKEDFVELFKDATKLSFVVKSAVADILAQHYSEYRKVDYSVSLRMEAYHCLSTIPYKYHGGFLDKPTLDDVDAISESLSGFVKDCFNKETSANKQIENAKRYIASNNFYIWRSNGEIVSMANIAHRSKRHARINEVYTKPQARGKGFAGMIVSELCKIIQNEDLTPILFTDLSNPASNKAYKNIGFVECGKVNEVTFNI